MKYEKILVPYDGSEHAQAAFTTARDLALAGNDTMLYVVNVVPMSATLTLHASESITSDPSSAQHRNRSDQIDEALAGVQAEMHNELVGFFDGLPEEQVRMEAIANPSPVQGLVEYAKSHDCDLIVMGRRGLGTVRGMLGSVSYGILRATDTPVLTVK